LVNQLNERCSNAIVEIKVYERDQRSLEIQFIVRDDGQRDRIIEQTQRLLREQLSAGMDVTIRYVDFIDHDYRRKYRVIERIGDVEFAGGIVGDLAKRETVRAIETSAMVGLSPLIPGQAD
jgi:hypothetical protein